MWNYILASQEDRVYPRVNKVQKGNVAIFNCYNNGPTLWKFKGKQLSSKVLLYEGRVLYLTNVQLADAGTYSCEGTDAHLNETFTTETELKIIGEQ